METEQSPEPQQSKCPVQGLIRRFKDLSVFLGLKKIPPKTLDSGLDWNVYCTKIHEIIFSQEDFFEPLFEKMIHHAKDRKAGSKEALWYGLFELGQKGDNYWALLWDKIYTEQKKDGFISFRKDRFEQLARVGIMNFQRFFEQIIFDLFDKGKNWQEIEQVLIHSNASFVDVGMSDAANEVLATTTTFEINDEGSAIQMCPFSGSKITADVMQKYKERVYTGCMLLGAKGIKGKTVLEDFLIVIAMIVYQYESWKKKNASTIQLVNLG